MPYVKDASGRALDRLLDHPTCIPTGMAKLDQLIDGLEPGELTYVCGRPGHGKSTLAMQLAASVAAMGMKALISSREMSAGQLIGRMAHAVSDVPKRMDRRYSVHERASLLHARAQIDDMPIWIEEGARDISAFRSGGKVARLCKGEGFSLVVVDYLQLMACGDMDGEPKYANISIGLKEFAREHNVPVVVVSQLSRACMTRGDEVPAAHDLRGSGQLEQDAYHIIAVVDHQQYRKSNYPWKTALHVIKAREGICGTVPVNYKKAQMRFEEMSESEMDIYDSDEYH